MNPSKENNESTLLLLSQLTGALTRHGIAKLPLGVRQGCVSFCGIIALVSPLLLWISWSKLVFYIVVSTAIISVLIVYIIVTFGPDENY